MEFLFILQISFFFLASLLLLLLVIFIAINLYYWISIVRHINHALRNIDELSGTLKRDVLDRVSAAVFSLSRMPFLRKFFGGELKDRHRDIKTTRKTTERNRNA